MTTSTYASRTAPAVRTVPPSGTMTSPTQASTLVADTSAAIDSRWLLDVPQACAALHVSRAQLVRLLAAGALIGIKIGRRRLLPVTSIESYISRLIAEEGGEVA